MAPPQGLHGVMILSGGHPLMSRTHAATIAILIIMIMIIVIVMILIMLIIVVIVIIVTIVALVMMILHARLVLFDCPKDQVRLN